MCYISYYIIEGIQFNLFFITPIKNDMRDKFYNFLVLFYMSGNVNISNFIMCAHHLLINFVFFLILYYTGNKKFVKRQKQKLILIKNNNNKLHTENIEKMRAR